MRGQILSVAMCVVVFATIAITATTNEANEDIEYFIKLSSDQQTLYLQDAYTDPGPDDMNVVLISIQQLNGHATGKLVDATILHDEENSVYKMWVVASSVPEPYNPWSVYYVESDSLLNWNAKNIQECYYGVCNSWGMRAQDTVSVLKDSSSGYKMWFHHYQADGWKTQIWYRSSIDGLTWTAPQLVIGAAFLDDWGAPTALPLANGNYRLYYSYVYRDVYDFIYLYRADVAPDGTTTSNVTQVDWTTFIVRGRLGASIIGDPDGDNHHRVWWTGDDGGNLLVYDSFDEGQSWTVEDLGTYTDTNYIIVETIVRGFHRAYFPLILKGS